MKAKVGNGAIAGESSLGVRQRPAQAAASGGDPNFMTSLARGLSVLQAFDLRRRALSIAQASSATGIPRASTRRCLHTLKKLGFLSESNGRYALRPRVLTLGFGHLSSLPLAVSAQPLLNRFRDRFHESCSLGVLDSGEVFYQARAETSAILSMSLFVGTRLPAYCTSMGRVLLAQLSETQLNDYLASAVLHPRTTRTITSPAQLRVTLQGVRGDGYAIVDQELELGLRSIAVPVFDHDGLAIAAVNVGVSSSRVSTKDLNQRLLPELKEIATALQLGI